MSITGTIVGYDPGGNLKHGLAIFEYQDGQIIDAQITTCDTAFDVLERVSECSSILGVGIDTLTYWGMGKSGWRPADKWLRKKYPLVQNSVASPNSLFGSMGINGMSVLISLRKRFREIVLSETHPKVLYYAMSGNKYEYSSSSTEMDRFLSVTMDWDIKTKNDHEWDAVISVYALYQGMVGSWGHDLHQLQPESKGHLVKPVGDTKYWWPDKASNKSN